MYKRGFTLIELLVVIAIIGILASIVMVNLSGAKAKSRDAKRIADIKNIQVSLEQYYNDNSTFPTTLSALVPNYLPVLPLDPINDTTYKYTYVAQTGPSSANCSSNPPIRYHLGAAMESNNTTNNNLTQDVDAGFISSNSGNLTGYTTCSGFNDFDGSSLNCAANSAAGTDNCYDWIP